MTTETLSYGQHGIRFWPEVGRAFVKRLRLPRPIMMASANSSLQARVDKLEAQLAKAEASAATHRDDFERERERCDRLTMELMRANIETMNAKEAAATAKEAAARVEAELTALRSRPWWRRLMWN